MERAYSCSATAYPFLAHPITSTTILKFRTYPILVSRVSSSFSSKRIILKRRKNYLRPKILKTLTKPFPTAPLTETLPKTENDSVSEPPNELIPFDYEEADKLEETDKFEEFRVSETVGTAKGGIFGRISAKYVLRFCGLLVGVYLFQTILSVWLVGGDDSSNKERNYFINGSNEVAYFDGIEMEKRISEIRAMAREVREKEKMERGQEGSNYHEENDIEKEIGARLVKLEKRLNSKGEKKFLHDEFMHYLGVFGNEEEEEEGNGNGENGLELNNDEKRLMFKKKFRFKSPSLNSRNSPKGFSGLRDTRSLSNVNGSDLIGESRGSEFGTMGSDSGRKDIIQLNSSQINGNMKESEDLQRDMGSGAVQKIDEGRTSTEGTEASNSQDVKKLKSLRKGNQRATTKFDGPAAYSIHGSRDPGKRPMRNKPENKQSCVQKNVWWLNLPYVLVILMRRGSEPEGSGLYTLRTLYQPADDHVDSYTVAFEDRSDANNFCCLLEFYFEVLGDFSADIVPLPVKELYEGVKSGSKKVIVVKKGQLQLYAGQPFAEVETALFSLLEQDQDTS